MRRTLLIIIAAVVIIIGGGLAFLASRVDSFRPQIQAELQKKLDRQVTLGHLGLRIFPLSVRIDHLAIAESPSFPSGRPFADAQQVFVSVGFFYLLTGSPEVKNLVLDHTVIELVRNGAGLWNFSTLGGSDKNAGSSSQKDRGSSQFSLNELEINDGQVAVTDQLNGQPRTVYNGIDLDLTDFAPGKRFGLNVGLHLPGAGKQQFAFKGKVGPLDAANAAATPVTGHISAQELSIASLNRLSPGLLPPNTDAVATMDADVSSENQTLLCKGNLKLRDSRIRGAKLDFPIAAQYDLTANRKDNQIQIRSSSLNLGATSFAASGNINGNTTPANVDVHLQTRDSSFSELARLAGAFGVAFNPAYQIKGTITADITAKGPTSAPQLNGSANAKGVEISGGEIKQPVSIPALALALTPDAVRAQNFTAQSGSTTVQAGFTLSHYTSPNSAIDATLSTNNANVAELLNMAKAYGLDATKGMSATGKLNLNVHAQGALAHASNLVLSGNGALTGATITTPQLTKPVTVTSANVQFAQNAASIANLNAAIGSTNLKGSLSAKNFSAPQVQFALTADNVDTTELQQLTPKSAASPPTKSAGGKPGSSSSLLDETTGTGTLAANKIKAENIVLSNLHANCKLDRGVIQLSPVTADLFGGKESGTVSMNTRPATPLCSIRTKLTGVDTNALLTAVSSLRDTLYGSLAGDANLDFALGSSADLARTMNGNVVFDVTNGELKNVNILSEVSKIGKFLKSAPTQSAGNSTKLQKLSGTLGIKNGVASTNDLKALLDAGSLSANGQLSLVDQGLNMHLNAVLPTEVSQTVGGTGVGGFLNTALSNSKGELVIPVLVSGTTSHPIFAPDVQAVAKMKLNNLLPTTGDPSKLTSGIIGAVSGKKGVGGALNQVLGNQPEQKGQNNSQDQNPVNSILKQFGKKKQQ